MMFTKRLEAEFFFCSPLVYLGLSLVVCCFSVQDQNIILQANKRTINLKHIKIDTTLLSVSALDVRFVACISNTTARAIKTSNFIFSLRGKRIIMAAL